MKKVVMFNRISLDGFYAGPHGEIDWFIPDPAVDQALHELMRLDTVLFGRITYQLFEGYWPEVARDPNAPAGARGMGNELNVMTKVVFSTTLGKLTWVNSILLKGNLLNEVRRMKQGDGRDIVIFGSGTIVQQLASEDLIDEYLILVTPVVLGAGKSLFAGVNKSNFSLVEGRNFDSGNVLLHYVLNKK